MKLALRILGVVLVLLGAVWILQGINVLPGSFMTGRIQWAVYGAVAVVAGCALLVAARKHRPGSINKVAIVATVKMCRLPRSDASFQALVPNNSFKPNLLRYIKSVAKEPATLLSPLRKSA